MIFSAPLCQARMIRRYKRFLADVEFDDGAVRTVHVPNTGSMLGCVVPGSRVWLSDSGLKTRKYPMTWELLELGGTWVGVNTHRANALVREAIEQGVLPSLSIYPECRGEVRYGEEGSRIDWLLTEKGGVSPCYVEVKNVTAAVDSGIALFPDAVSQRATRHLRELVRQVQAGHRAVIVFCVQRNDVTEVRPADAIDPEYGQALREALEHGVEALACRATLSSREITLNTEIPVVCP